MSLISKFRLHSIKPHELVYRANTLNQYFTNHTISFPAIWSPQHENWYCKSPSNRLHNYYKLSFAIKIASILVLTCICIICKLDPKSLPPLLKQLVRIELVFYVLAISIDLICYQHTSDLIYACNWGYSKQKVPCFPTNWTELIPGIASLFFTVCIQGSALSTTLMFVLSNFDPIYTLLVLFKLGHLTNSMFLKVFRLLYWLYFAQLVTTSIRYLAILGSYQGLVRCILLKRLTNGPSLASGITCYREIIIVSNIVKKFEIKATATGFTIGYIVVIVSVLTLVSGLRKGNVARIAFAFGLICLGMAILEIIFICGCSYRNNSQEILAIWKNQLDKKSRYKIKLMKSLPLLSIPAGSVGIIDKYIKVNFLNSLLQSLINVMVIMKDRL